ncbi:right-handed parallel beta-helix repeat-containing protein [Sphingomonas sp. MMS24-J13]|uniref:right-handed parallel beta-helix repeat-containing protein n=1 Tax=Sphingomonas sp. MMS24-J13 TaxID=3238686 RepID=UPI00384F43EA
MAVSMVPQCAVAKSDPAWLTQAIDIHWGRARERAGATQDSWTVALAPNGVGPSADAHNFVEAQARVHALLADIRAGKKPAKPIVVHVATGTYTLSKPLLFGPDDGGDAKFPVSYVADDPGHVTISGGVALAASGMAGRRMTFDLPASLTVDWSVPQQLFVNGQRAVLARQPNEGATWLVQPGSKDKGTVIPDAKALQWLQGLSADDRARAELFLYQSWTSSLHHFTVNGNAVQLAVPAKWAPLAFGNSQRFFVENVTAALDAPGEWIGTGRQVTYIPSGDQAGSPAAQIPVLPRLIQIKGTATNPVGYLSFTGMQFLYTASTPNAGNFVDLQGASAIGAAIEADFAHDIAFRNCLIAHVGGYGIWMRASVSDSLIDDNVVYDTGAGAVRLSIGGQPGSDALITHNITVTNNVLAETGKIFPGGPAIFVGWSNDNRLENNLVANTTNDGVSIGGKWPVGGPVSARNHINRNIFFNIGQGMLSDIAAIYTLSGMTGTEINENFIREARSYTKYGGWFGAGAAGIYLDEGTSGVTARNNVVVNTDSGGFHINYGRDNVAEGNVLAGGEQAEVTLLHDRGGKAMDFRRNTLFPISSKPFQGALTNATSSFEGNAVAGAGSAGQDVGTCGRGCAKQNAQLSVGPGLLDVHVSGAGTGQQTIDRVLANAGPHGDMAALRDVVITERRPKLSPPNPAPNP